MVKFNFNEAELINGFFEGVTGKDAEKSNMIGRLEDAKNNTEDPELVTCADETIGKLKLLDDDQIQLLVSSLPVYEGFSI